MKIVDNANCLYCKKYEDNFRHFFLFCEKIDSFWNDFLNWWNNLGDIRISLLYDTLEESFLFGFQTKGEIFTVLNYCLLIAKHHIYYNRIHNDNNVNFFQYLVYLKSKLMIEKQICLNNKRSDFDKYVFLYEQL